MLPATRTKRLVMFSGQWSVVRGQRDRRTPIHFAGRQSSISSDHRPLTTASQQPIDRPVDEHLQAKNHAIRLFPGGSHSLESVIGPDLERVMQADQLGKDE